MTVFDPTRNCWGFLGILGKAPGLLGRPRDCWGLLGRPRNCWEGPGVFRVNAEGRPEN